MTNNQYDYLTKFNEYLDIVNRKVTMKELQKNIGDRITNNELNILDAIYRGDINRLKELNKKGYYIQYYKEVMIRLAVKFGYTNIVRYLIESKQLNSHLSMAIAELDDGRVFRNMVDEKNFDNFEYTGKLESWRCGIYLTPNWELYKALGYIIIEDVYVWASIYKNTKLIDTMKNMMKLDYESIKNYHDEKYKYDIDNKTSYHHLVHLELCERLNQECGSIAT